MIVVKVGGSLYDHPHLKAGLSLYISNLAMANSVTIIPGGGSATNAVREWDRIHTLGLEASHRLAIQSLSLTARFLSELLDVPVQPEPSKAGVTVLDCNAWLCTNDGLPHTWGATSDSIAAFVAECCNASQLILLKSVNVPNAVPWAEAAEVGWVDAHFPTIARRLNCPINIINFRSLLSQLRYPTS